MRAEFRLTPRERDLLIENNKLQTALAECLSLLADEYQFVGHVLAGCKFKDRELIRRMNALVGIQFGLDSLVDSEVWEKVFDRDPVKHWGRKYRSRK